MDEILKRLDLIDARLDFLVKVEAENIKHRRRAFELKKKHVEFNKFLEEEL